MTTTSQLRQETIVTSMRVIVTPELFVLVSTNSLGHGNHDPTLIAQSNFQALQCRRSGHRKTNRVVDDVVDFLGNNAIEEDNVDDSTVKIASRALTLVPPVPECVRPVWPKRVSPIPASSVGPPCILPIVVSY